MTVALAHVGQPGHTPTRRTRAARPRGSQPSHGGSAQFPGGTPPPTSSTTSPPPPVTAPPGGSGACSATYLAVGQWNGGFQAEVRVTAGSAAIRGWTGPGRTSTGSGFPGMERDGDHERIDYDRPRRRLQRRDRCWSQHHVRLHRFLGGTIRYQPRLAPPRSRSCIRPVGAKGVRGSCRGRRPSGCEERLAIVHCDR